MTEWIIDPDPTTLRIGQECEAQEIFEGSWFPAILQGHEVPEIRRKPWRVVDTRKEQKFLTWAAHIRVKMPIRYGPVSTAGAGKVKPSFDDFWGEVKEYNEDEPEPKAESTALVPMTQKDAQTLRNIAKWPKMAELQTRYCLEDLADRIEAHMPKPKPKRPEIAVDEPVWVGAVPDRLYKRHFAGWSTLGRPQAWDRGKTSHTGDSKTVWAFIKTKDGTVWPPPDGEGEK